MIPLARAEESFGFLGDLGFRIAERFVTGGDTNRDGWRLVYSTSTVSVTVQYFDMQLEVLFVRSGVEADYLLIDRELLGRRSDLHGNMFPPQKLAPAIDRIAADIRAHFGAILEGDAAVWTRIQRLLEAPKDKSRMSLP